MVMDRDHRQVRTNPAGVFSSRTGLGPAGNGRPGDHAR
jgi:hypothetical protein